MSDWLVSYLPFSFICAYVLYSLHLMSFHVSSQNLHLGNSVLLIHFSFLPYRARTKENVSEPFGLYVKNVPLHMKPVSWCWIFWFWFAILFCIYHILFLHDPSLSSLFLLLMVCLFFFFFFFFVFTLTQLKTRIIILSLIFSTLMYLSFSSSIWVCLRDVFFPSILIFNSFCTFFPSFWLCLLLFLFSGKSATSLQWIWESSKCLRPKAQTRAE